jgi:hypothetical protein
MTSKIGAASAMNPSTDTTINSYIPQDDQDVSSSSQETVHGFWWLIAVAGLGLMALSAVVIYETLELFATGAAAWLDCSRSENGALLDCGTPLAAAYEYRFGVDALRALGAALLGAFIGPIPMIFVLNRYRSTWAGILLFLLVMLPYGLLAFLVLVLGTLVIAFYGIEIA